SKRVKVDIPLSVGLTEPRTRPLHRGVPLGSCQMCFGIRSGTVPVNCISTEWTLSFPTSGEYLEHVHASSCQIKVFKVKTHERLTEKIEKKSLQDGEKYQLSYETTILTEWRQTGPRPSPAGDALSTYSTNHQGEPLLLLCSDTHILSFSSLETQERLHQNNFSTFCRLFTDFSAADSLNMSRDDVVQICCPADSIRLFDTIKGRPSHLTVYVSQQKIRNQLRGRPACNDVTTVKSFRK
uniref:Transcription factor CP2-like 1 n=1 Tax=Electrophorus electricus TaxID=8005 RepID=A0AAY5EEF2_ELEEL